MSPHPRVGGQQGSTDRQLRLGGPIFLVRPGFSILVGPGPGLISFGPWKPGRELNLVRVKAIRTVFGFSANKACLRSRILIKYFSGFEGFLFNSCSIRNSINCFNLCSRIYDSLLLLII